MQEFCKIALEEFSFLETDFKCKKIEEKEECWGGKVIYVNSTTGIEITYEYREAYLFIMVYRLLDGKLVKTPRNITEDTKIHSFGLDDAIHLLVPNKLLKPAYEYGENSKYYDENSGLRNYTREFANNLKNFGNSFLNGDFSLMPEIKEIIRDRVKKYS